MLSTLALYLPQFHRVPENDRWWGEGFTEWTAAKGAEKLYEGHNQPRVPLHDNYYDLLEYDTMAWQARLMKKYRIDGMCMYHYWFDNGRRILEKPAENLLKWTDIAMPFCFCWANQSWIRTWKKMTDEIGNIWASAYEEQGGQKDNGILLKQEYGREQDWEEHFQYLLPFFLDDRYIRQEGKPVFGVLYPGSIYPLWSMIHYFDTRAKEYGLPGIYVIGMEDTKMKGLDAVCAKQPVTAMDEYLAEQKELVYPVRYPYEVVWEKILNHKLKSDKAYLCGVVDYDDTPRMGKKKGHIVEGASPEKFYHYFKQLYRKSMQLHNEFIFINAWNEWGEGMYIEPDEKYGYGYLEAVKRAVTECEKEEVEKDTVSVESYYETAEERELRRKENWFHQLYRHDLLLERWLCLREQGMDFTGYFRKYGYRRVAIYGMGKLGRHLLYELRRSGIEVPYGIDRNYEGITSEIPLYGPGQQMPETDAVVITNTGEYGEISEILDQTMDCPLVMLEEIFKELMPEIQDSNSSYGKAGK